MQPGVNIFSPAVPSDLSGVRPAYTPFGIERRFGHFSPGLFLAQVLVGALPAAGLFAIGRASLAGYYFFAMLGFLLLRLAFLGRRDEMLCLILAAGPFLNLLRGFIFYNVVIALFVLGLLYFVSLSSGTLRDTLKKVPLVWTLALSVTVFYSISFINTRNYSINVRLFELVFAVIYVLVIGRNPVLLGAALLGNLVSACAVGFAMLPNMVSGGRLGMVETDGQVLGNPTQLGLPLALSFLALSVDRGRWLNLQTKLFWRLLLIFPVLCLLALTTSRAAWLVAGGGLLLALIFGSRQRLKMGFIILLAVGAFVAVLHSPYGATLQRGLKRTFGEQQSMSHRTSGRSDQWKVAWYSFNRSLDSMIRGYGPGAGPDVYAKYSGLVDGVKYGVGKKVALHSLFMQIGVETGLAGLVVLFLWLATCFCKILKRTLHGNPILPLISFFGYVFIVVTVSGGDINSGLFLGIALLGTLSSMTTLARQKTAALSPQKNR
jgi:O-antigen ligase